MNGEFLGRKQVNGTDLGSKLVLIGLIASMTVNAVVTGLIAFRIFDTFLEAESIATSDEEALGIIGGRKVRSIIFIIVESGLALFAIQLARALVTGGTYGPPEPGQQMAANNHLNYIASIHEMLNVTILSVIVIFLFTDNLDLSRV